MYLFMKMVRFTHLNLKRNTEYEIIYSHWRKTTKIRNEWRNFAQLQNLQVETQIIFEFLDETSNFILFWICL